MRLTDLLPHGPAHVDTINELEDVPATSLALSVLDRIEEEDPESNHWLEDCFLIELIRRAAEGEDIEPAARYYVDWAYTHTNRQRWYS